LVSFEISKGICKNDDMRHAWLEELGASNTVRETEIILIFKCSLYSSGLSVNTLSSQRSVDSTGLSG